MPAGPKNCALVAGPPSPPKPRKDQLHRAHAHPQDAWRYAMQAISRLKL
jgi:hypothetical protein